jgi:hypothetical protein
MGGTPQLEPEAGRELQNSPTLLGVDVSVGPGDLDQRKRFECIQGVGRDPEIEQRIEKGLVSNAEFGPDLTARLRPALLLSKSFELLGLEPVEVILFQSVSASGCVFVRRGDWVPFSSPPSPGKLGHVAASKN